MDLPEIIRGVLDKEGLLAQVYTDLAAPGVRQVGKALETVIETGCFALLPLRMMNSRARAWEQKNFNDFAERLAGVPEEEVIPIRPEIAVPIFDHLSRTADSDLRALFVNLLASSAKASMAANCHPSFAHIIAALSPDEARLLKEWCTKSTIPFLNLGRKIKTGIHSGQTHIIEFSDEIELRDMVPVYIANLTGLGLISHTTDNWLSDDTEYQGLIEHVRKKYPDVLESRTQISQPFIRREVPDEYIFYEKGIIKVEPYGMLFQKACF